MKRAIAALAAALCLLWGCRAENIWTQERWAEVRWALTGDGQAPVPAEYRFTPSPLPAPEDEDRGLTLLLMSTDAEDMGSNFGRTDLLLLCRVDYASGAIRLLSLPEEAPVALPGLPGPVMLRYVNCFGGPSLVLHTLEDDLGAGAFRYCAVNEAAFRAIVDALEGVTLSLTEGEAQAMGRDAGENRLNGEDALRYVRLRRQGDGSARARRLMEAVAKQLTAPGSAQRIYQLPDLLLPLLDTNLTTKNLVDAVCALADRSAEADFSADALRGLDEEARTACQAFFTEEDQP